MTTKARPFGLRMPLAVRRRIARSAAANQRSLNAELVVRLQESVAREMSHLPDETAPRSPQEATLLRHFSTLSERRQIALIDALIPDWISPPP